MDKRDQFEEKIKAKLEGVSAADADQAWQSFAPLLHPPSPPFWKHWFMPYLFSSFLFLAYLGWHQWEEQRPVGTPLPTGNPVAGYLDTLYLRDTLYVIDTVIVYKKVYVEERQTLSSRLQMGMPSNPTGAENPLLTEEKSKEMTQSSTQSTHTSKQTPLRKQLEKESGRGSSADSISNAPNSTGQYSVPMASRPSSALLEVAEGAAASSDTQSSTSQARRSMAAPSVGPKPTVVFRSEKELVVGDTSNRSNPPLRQKSKPLLHLELGTSMLFPISRLVEYYKPLQQSIQVGLEWESGWGVYLGAIRNQMEGELDDEEIMSLDQELVASLPNVPANRESLDEVYFINRQWFFPLELRWRSLYYSGFSFESSLGIMGNYLHRQDFTYEFENNADIEYQYGTTSKGEFSLSHLRVGIGTNYLLSRRMGLFLRSHYWLPVSRPGLIQDRVHGLELGVGVNFYLGK